MDKYEFNIKVEQIRKLVGKNDYATAMKIADTIDWRRVRNANLLSMISEVYEKNREYQEAKEVLLLAFERAPIGKRLLYKLTELALREGSISEAEDYYREFCDLSPDDTRQHLLRYMLLKEKKAPMDQIIHALERYISTEVDEKWMYELADLYARAGRTSDCIQLCDKMILMFGVGAYVEKAMELKQRYAPLTSYQKDLIQNRDKYEEKLRAVEEGYENGTIRIQDYQEPGNTGFGVQGAGAESYEASGYGQQSAGYGGENNSYGQQQTAYVSGNDGYGQPQGGYMSGSDGYGQPQGGYVPGSDGYGHSQGDYMSGSDGYNQPQGGYMSGSDGYGHPQGSYMSEAESYQQPEGGYMSESDGYGQSQGGYVPGAGDYGQSQGGYASGAGGYGQSQGGYASGAGDYGQSQGGYASGAGGYGQPQGGYASGAGGYGQPQGGYAFEADPYGQSQGGYEPGAGSYGQPQDSYGSGGYNQSQAGYVPAEGAYDQAGSGYTSEAGGYSQSQDGYMSGNPAYGDSQGGYDQFQGGYIPETDGYGQSQDGYIHGERGYSQQTDSYMEEPPVHDPYQGNYMPESEGYGRFGNAYPEEAESYGYPQNGYMSENGEYDQQQGGYGGYGQSQAGYGSANRPRQTKSGHRSKGGGSGKSGNGYRTRSSRGPSDGRYMEENGAYGSAADGSYGEQHYSQENSNYAYEVDEELMANLHQAAAEKELAAEMSKISTEGYVEREPGSGRTKVFRDRHGMAVVKRAEEREQETKYHDRVYTPHHLMIEAKIPETGFETAVEVLKKIHQKTGVNNQVIKISGSKLSRRGIFNVSDKLAGKDLIVEEAGDLSQEDLEELQMLLERDETGMIVVLIDNPFQMKELHQQNPGFVNLFQCIDADGQNMDALEAPEERETQEETAKEPAYEPEEPVARDLTKEDQGIALEKPTAEAGDMDQTEEDPPYEEKDSFEENLEDEDIYPDETVDEPGYGEEYDEAYENRDDEEYDEAYEDGDDEEYDEAYENGDGEEYDEAYEDEDGEEYGEAYEDGDDEEYDGVYEDEDGEEYDGDDEDYGDEYEDDGDYDDEYEDESGYEDEYESPAPVDDEELDLNEFADYAVKYARDIDCNITGKSMLALYERIELMEEDGIPLTRTNAEDLIEEAADKAEKPSLSGLLKGVFASKYDKDGLLILKEEHFI